MSLYNKYRPQLFSQLVGQENIVNHLKHAIETNSLHHAYLFSGPRGTGKTTTARILAKRLNCENPAGLEPCNVCSSCVSISKGTSLAVTEYDAASNSGVKEMRETILDSTKFAPMGKYRIIIIDEVHMLSTAAANAALKTWEEPPERVIFILATTDPKKLLPTLRSRCVPLKFSLIPQQTLQPFISWVAQQENIDENLVAPALAVGQGSVRDTLSTLESIVGMDNPQTVSPARKLCESMGSGDVSLMFKTVAEIAAEGEDIRGVTEETAGLLREVFLGLMGAEDLVTQVDWGQRKTVADNLGARRVVSGIEFLGEAVAGMAGGGDPRVNLEINLARWVKTN